MRFIFAGWRRAVGKYLFDENPISLSPELAAEIGMEGAAVLQQIRFWENNNKLNDRNFYEGFYWVYNTYADWQETNFFFLSERKVADTIRFLEKENLIISAQFKKAEGINTKFYRVNPEAMESLENHRRKI